jgi:capsid protein
MGLLADFKEKLTNSKKLESLQNELKTIQANYQQLYYYYPPIYFAPYTGEKTPGEMGAAKNYNLQYNYLRTRSWQAFLESELAQIIINKSCLWTIGTGLKVQPEPNQIVLKQEGINFDPSDLIKQIESRFTVYSDSRFSDFSKMMPLDHLAFEAHKNAKVGGDVLVILRIDNNFVNVQLVDGSHVISPYFNSEYMKQAQERGNFVRHGVEMNENMEHIAYYVQNQLGKSTRIPRIGDKSGNLMAFLVYGNRYRIDNTRGLPMLSSVLETIKKLDRYKEATVGSAEEVAKIAYFVKHGTTSNGESVLLSKLAQSTAMGMGQAPETKSIDAYEAAATKIATTTNKQVFNMPIDSSLETLKNESQLYFKDFYETNAKSFCAAVGIPYEVAMAMYNSNYSASRAAIKDWEYTMKTDRTKFSDQFYQPIYNLWFEIQVLIGKLQAPGYIKAINDNNIMAIEAYRQTRWLGTNAPQIDPVKEVTAERLKLGDYETPLTTYDQATETLGSGDFSTIMTKVKIEQKLTDGLKKQQPDTAQLNKKQSNKDALFQVIKETLIEAND